jgi:signal transduction histidine kinase
MSHQETAYFSVDSRLLFQLGEKLVTDRAVALAELVKNSYDADATLVIVKMQKIKGQGGTIIIVDNGIGINLESFKQNWMRIATIDKEENPVSSIYKRSKAGEKGIGRFACRRLSAILELESIYEVADNKKEKLKASFQWSNFVPGSDVNKTPIICSTNSTDPQTPTGTTLILVDTSEPWTADDFKRMRYELHDLISPSTFRGEQELRTHTHDPGFNVEFDCPEFPMQVEPLDKTFFKNAWARIIGTVDEKGIASYELEIQKGKNLKKKFQRDEAFKYLRDVRMETHIFSYRADFFKYSDLGLRQAQLIGNDRGGIKVYADNFRVFGYGSKGDDWLRTDYDRARSIIMLDKEVNPYVDEGGRPGLALFRNNNLFGHVQFSRETNKLLEITVNRERITSSKAFEELRKFARLGIDFATVLYANQVAKEQQEAEAKKKAQEEARAKAAERARRDAEEARRAAEQEARKADEEKRRNEEEINKADHDVANAYENRKKAEENRRKAESERRSAENKARQTGSKNDWAIVHALLREEKKFIEAEKLAIENEVHVVKHAEEVKEKVKDKRASADDEVKKAEDKRREAEEVQRKAEEDALRRQEEKFRKEYTLLRVLASTGTLILIFEHELQALIDDMEEMISSASSILKQMPESQVEEFNLTLKSFSDRTEMVKELGELFGVTIGTESRAEKKDWVVYPIVESIFRPLKRYLNQNGINHRNTVPEDLRTPRMYRSELVSILQNLLTNAFKAVKGEHKREIEITGSTELGNVYIKFLDSGKGLNKTRWGTVFEPFESDSEPDIKFGVGTGLGLKIVRDIARSYNGDAQFCDPPEGWSTCVEITLGTEE